MGRPPGKRPPLCGQGNTALTATGYQAPVSPLQKADDTCQPLPPARPPCHACTQAAPALRAPQSPAPARPPRPRSGSDKALRSWPSSLRAPRKQTISKDPEPSPPQGGPADHLSSARAPAPPEDALRGQMTHPSPHRGPWGPGASARREAAPPQRFPSPAWC